MFFISCFKSCVSQKMELSHEHFFSMIYYDFWRRLTKQQYIDELNSKFGDGARSFASVKHKYEFNHGHRSLNVEFCGLPNSVVFPENIVAVQHMIIQNRHVTYCEIETSLGISSTTIIYKILHSLSKAHKEARVDWR